MLPHAAAAACVLALSAQASAYCLTYTCDVKKEDCPFDPETHCNVGGKPLYWASSVVSYDVQKDGSKLRNITADQLEVVVTNGFKRWMEATCDDGGNPSIELKNFGKVSCAKPEYNKSQPNQNVITFHDEKWPYQDTGAETLALTTVFFAPDTGEIYDANIELNSYDAKFVIGSAE